MGKKINIILSIAAEKGINAIRSCLEKSKNYKITLVNINTEIFNDTSDRFRNGIFIVDEKYSDEVSLLHFIREVNEKLHNDKIIITLEEENPEKILEYYSAGAGGYILKNEIENNCHETIEDINNGGICMMKKIMKCFALVMNNNFIHLEYQLTRREKQINYYMQQGLACKDIGKRLYISPATVRTHIRNIKSKSRDFRIKNKNLPLPVSRGV